MTTRIKIIVLLSLALLSTTVCAQEKPSELDSKVKKEVVERIAEMVQKYYVFSEVAGKNAKYLKSRLNENAYAKIDDWEGFAEMLTNDLRHVNKDKHMRVKVRKAERVRMEKDDPVLAQLKQMERLRADNFGFKKVEMLENNVGYVDFRYFNGTAEARDVATSALRFLQNADAIMIDMRKNGGGSPSMVQFICSFFFGEKTHLNSLYWREGDQTREFWTLDSLPGERMPDTPVFILTSAYTFSGAEEFSYNFQPRNRATLVGETTGGGANPGGTEAINDMLSIFIPTGKAINPVTNTNWEGVGVTPDVNVPADSAFDVAYRLASKAAVEFAAKQERNAEERVSTFWGGLEKSTELSANKQEKAVAEILLLATEDGLVDEGDVNQLGYHYLMDKEDTGMAIAAFLFNTKQYPESSNTYDSLGEAYMKSGQKKLAIYNYEKSLKLNPQNDNAVKMLKKLRS